MKKLLAIMLVLIISSISTTSAMMDNRENDRDNEMRDEHMDRNENSAMEYKEPRGNIQGGSVDKNEVHTMDNKESEMRNESMNKNENNTMEYKEPKGNVQNVMPVDKNEVHTMNNRENEMEKHKNEREEIKNNREEMNKNREEMKNMDVLKKDFKDLDENTKNELKDTYDKYNKKISELEKELKNSLNDENKRTAIENEMEKLRQDNYDNIKSKLANNPTILKEVEKKEAIFKKNKALRDNNEAKKKALRGDRSKFILKYKEAFNNRLANVIDSIPDDKLQTVADKIDAAIAKIESMTTLSDSKKNDIMDQVLALKEIIDEKIAANTAKTDVIDINSLLTF